VLTPSKVDIGCQPQPVPIGCPCTEQHKPKFWLLSALHSPHPDVQVCHYCFKAFQPEAAYPCQQCQLAWYCSTAHRDADGFHRPGSRSCGVPWTALLEERAVLATRLALATQACDRPHLLALRLWHPFSVPPSSYRACDCCLTRWSRHDFTLQAFTRLLQDSVEFNGIMRRSNQI